MSTGALTSYLDTAQVVLYAFWVFFAGLIIYLRREDKREGYPLESDRSGRIQVVGFPRPPAPKTFLLSHGRGTRTAPRAETPALVAAEPVGGWPGAPLEPTGDPMRDGVGPAAYAMRTDAPDLAEDGEPKLRPLRIATQFHVAPRDPDPRGMAVVAADGGLAGTVADIWVDRSEPQIRYLEVDTGERRVLLPINFSRIDGQRRQIRVASIFARHFADVPGIANQDQVTAREEDRITAYYAGGHLYADPSRAEPLL
jgi:photosynthetic reaction center H subunit